MFINMAIVGVLRNDYNAYDYGHYRQLRSGYNVYKYGYYGHLRNGHNTYAYGHYRRAKKCL